LTIINDVIVKQQRLYFHKNHFSSFLPRDAL